MLFEKVSFERYFMLYECDVSIFKQGIKNKLLLKRKTSFTNKILLKSRTKLGVGEI